MSELVKAQDPYAYVPTEYDKRGEALRAALSMQKVLTSSHRDVLKYAEAYYQFLCGNSQEGQ